MTPSRNPATTPTVSRVGERVLVELLYDAIAKVTKLAICQDGEYRIDSRIVLGTGEILVPFEPTNNLIRHRCVCLPSDIVPHGGKASLLRDLEAYLHRYVDLTPQFERIVARYILLSWVFDAFNEVPYLRFQGDYGSGKTRALMAVGSVVYKGFFASGASTVSPIFHTLDTFGGTLILDEADLRFSDKTADVVKILNNGTVRGLPVLRSVQSRTKVFNPAAFNVYGPKLVAMRGAFRDQALESRFLTEPMGRRPLRSDIPIQLPDQLAADALQLRNRLLHFRLTNLFTIRTNASPIASLGPRLNQTGAALLAITDEQHVQDEIAERLRDQQARLDRDRMHGIEMKTAAAIGSLFAADARPHVPLHEIARRVSADGVPATPRDIGRVLRSLGIALHKSHGTIVVPRTAGDVHG